MKIVKLEVENLKRVVKVDITPGGLMVLITGPNGAGKSSVLDAIWWALAGERSHQSVPIRTGEKTARVSLDLGAVVVTREWARRSESDGATSTPERVTTRLLVENADGSRFTSPQKMLDSLLGSLTFDPLAFSRASDREQVERLSGLCGLDMAEIERAHKTDFDARTGFNRASKSKRAAADAITVPTDTPDQPVSVSALVQKVRDTEAANRDLENERRRRDGEQKRAEHLRDSATRLREQAASDWKRADAEACELEERAVAARERGRAIEVTVREGADARLVEADRLASDLAGLSPVEPNTDTAVIQEQVEAAEQTNEHVRSKRRKVELLAESCTASISAGALTDQMDKRRVKAREAIAAADLGIDGLTVEDGRVMLGDHPFDQASDAERLLASCAIAGRGDAKLRVLRIRDGSLLDEHSLRLAAEWAEKNDYQIWLERVSTTGKVGIVIEDGKVKR